MSEKPESKFLGAIEYAPDAFLLLDDSFIVQNANQRASELGFRSGERLSKQVDARTFDHVRRLWEGDEADRTTGVSIQGRALELTFIPNTGLPYWGLWIKDNAELNLVQKSLQRLSRPEKKTHLQLSNLISATLGYSELVELMLEENKALGQEQRSTIRKYQKEVSAGLQQSERIIRGERGKSLPGVPGTGSGRHVLVVHRDPHRTELLTELLRSQNFKVTSFNNLSVARKFVSLNAHNLDLAIVSDTDNLHLDLDPSLQLLICSSSDNGEESHARIEEPLDINQLMAKVVSLTGGSA